MNSSISRCAGLVALALLSAGCSLNGGQGVVSQTPPEHSCTVSTLELGPDGFDPYGLARAGPVWFSAFGRVNPGTPAQLAPGGGPYDGWKVVIHPDPKAGGVVNLSGVQCSSGAAIRFCYSGCNWDTRLRTSVAAMTVDVGDHRDYTGYMVFPGPGLMRLTATDSHGVVASVVLDVPTSNN